MSESKDKKWIIAGSLAVMVLAIGLTVWLINTRSEVEVIQLTAEDLEQLKYDADLAERARKQADSIRDQNYIMRDTDTAEPAPMLKGLDVPKPKQVDIPTPKAAESRRIQEEEAINYILRETPSASAPPAAQQQPAAQQTANQTPMFVYSRVYGGAKYVEPKILAKAETPAAQDNQLDTLTLAALGLLTPTATPTFGDAISTNEEQGQTRLLYNNLSPVTVHEGEMLEAVLENRLLVDTEPSPVVCKLSRDVFDKSGQYVIFPASSRVIGISQTISYKGASRLFISFHRIILPNGLSVDLPNSRQRMKAMDATGAIGIVSSVDRHWMMQFGAAVFLGVIDGIAGYAQRNNQQAITADGYVISRTSENFERVVDRIMAQYSSIVPTIRVDQGKILNIYISEDMTVSPYARISERSYYAAH